MEMMRQKQIHFSGNGEFWQFAKAQRMNKRKQNYFLRVYCVSETD